MKKVLFFFSACVLLSGCATAPPITSTPGVAASAISEPPPEPPSASETTEPAEPSVAADTRVTTIEAYIDTMTLPEKIASLFWVSPEQLGGTKHTFTEQTTRALADNPVSGVVFFASNIKDEVQTRALTAAFRAEGKPGFVVAVDEEGGRVSRLGGVGGFPKTPAMGALRDGQAVYNALRNIGDHLVDWGFNLDLAPVCDVLTWSDDPVIGDRSFGQDAETVSALVTEAVRGLLDSGAQPCLKHFPGHGGAVGDSHKGAVSVPYDLTLLRSVDWPPFAAGVTAGARIIMVGHIALPEATGDDIPASLSHAIVTDFLRKELCFDGLVVTDSMQMGAITERLDAGEAAVQALLAGCDVILMPEDLSKAIDGVRQAVMSGRLDESRLDLSIRRRLEIFFTVD